MEAKPVTTEASAVVSATAGGQRSEATLLVVPQGVVSVNPSSSAIWAGESEHVLMLEGPLSSGTAIELTSSQPDIVSFDAAEPVEGRACARFRMRVKPVREATPLTITGAVGERRSSITITVRPGQAVTSLKLDQTHAFNGAKVTGTVGVAEPALPGQEVVVQLSTEDPAVMVSANRSRTFRSDKRHIPDRNKTNARPPQIHRNCGEGKRQRSHAVAGRRSGRTTDCFAVSAENRESGNGDDPAFSSCSGRLPVLDFQLPTGSGFRRPPRFHLMRTAIEPVFPSICSLEWISVRLISLSHAMG